MSKKGQALRGVAGRDMEPVRGPREKDRNLKKACDWEKDL